MGRLTLVGRLAGDTPEAAEATGPGERARLGSGGGGGEGGGGSESHGGLERRVRWGVDRWWLAREHVTGGTAIGRRARRIDPVVTKIWAEVMYMGRCHHDMYSFDRKKLSVS
jgi:hypothetical protein